MWSFLLPPSPASNFYFSLDGRRFQAKLCHPTVVVPYSSLSLCSNCSCYLVQTSMEKCEIKCKMPSACGSWKFCTTNLFHKWPWEMCWKFQVNLLIGLYDSSVFLLCSIPYKPSLTFPWRYLSFLRFQPVCFPCDMNHLMNSEQISYNLVHYQDFSYCLNGNIALSTFLHCNWKPYLSGEEFLFWWKPLKLVPDSQNEKVAHMMKKWLTLCWAVEIIPLVVVLTSPFENLGLL